MGTDGEPSDIELMLSVKGDDVEAFRALAGRYRGPLCRFFTALTDDPARAEDFTQETFLRLWLARGRYEPSGVFSTYLFQIGKHYWWNQRKKAHPELPLDEDGLDLRAPRSTQPEQAVLERARTARVRRAIDGLPDIYRSVFAASHLEGRPYAEIARELGIPVGTVKSRMAEALRRLRCALMNDEGGS